MHPCRLLTIPMAHTGDKSASRKSRLIPDRRGLLPTRRSEKGRRLRYRVTEHVPGYCKLVMYRSSPRLVDLCSNRNGLSGNGNRISPESFAVTESSIVALLRRTIPAFSASLI